MEHRIHHPETDGQDLETIYSLLSDRYCRAVADVVSQRNAPISLDELASALVETAAVSKADTARESHEIVASLHHIQLPKLDDTGVIEYDPETNVVTPARTELLASFPGPSDESDVNAK